VKRLLLTTLTLSLAAGCASTDSAQSASREETYIALGSYLPRKTGNGKDERTFIDKEEFKRQADMVAGAGSKP
jgi:hypothetical protein